MPQAAQRFAFDLADAFSREAEFLPDLLQCVLPSILEAEAQPQDTCLARCERAQDFFDFLAEEVSIRALCWRRRRIVFDKAAEFAVFFLANRPFEAERTPTHLEHPLDLARFEVHTRCDL